MMLEQFLNRKDGQDDLRELINDLAKLRARKDAVNQRKRVSAPYEPKLLCPRKFLLSAETQNAVSRAEIAIARFDYQIQQSSHRASLSQALARLEGIASVYTNGVKPSYYACSLLDAHLQANPQSINPTQSIAALIEQNQDDVESVLLAHRIQGIITEIITDVPKGEDIVPRTIVSLHQRLEGGRSHANSAGYRTRNYKNSHGAGQDTSEFCPPAPAKIPRYLQDLADFCNRDQYSLLVKSAIAHYQLEATRAFESNLDQLGRVLATHLWKTSGLITTAMPPFSIVPAATTLRHASKLEPYRGSSSFEKDGEILSVDEWVFHSACGCIVAVEVACRLQKELEAMFQTWSSTLGKKASKNTLKYLETILGYPAFTLPLIEHSIGCAPSTAAEITKSLVGAGIIREASKQQRNRVYEAPGVLTLFAHIEKGMFPDNPLPLDSYLE